MQWPDYLARGVHGTLNNPTMLYHMCEVKRFQAAFNSSENKERVYFPPTYAQDGFIHATAVPSMLLVVANHFYTDSEDDWLCLELDPRCLGAEVKYEPAAPVGEKQTMQKKEVKEDEPLFPHIYGGLPKLAVTKVFKINRDAEGKFLSIDGLVPASS